MLLVSNCLIFNYKYDIYKINNRKEKKVSEELSNTIMTNLDVIICSDCMHMYDYMKCEKNLPPKKDGELCNHYITVEDFLRRCNGGVLPTT